MIYISIGSNLGNRLGNIRQAISLLKDNVLGGLRYFPVLETKAIMTSDAPVEWDRPFLNTIISGETSLGPEELLASLKAIETTLGRPATHKKWEPRVIDLDILLYNDLVMEAPSLTIPHKELCNRPFLVHLLALIDSGLRYPKGNTFCEIARSFSNINECFDRALAVSPKLVGVVNITPDSFSDGGKYFAPQKAIEKALELADDGAVLVELGAQSTRPGAVIIDAHEEYMRLSPVLDGLSKAVKISIDSFYPEVIQKVLKSYPVSCINDVKGDLDDETLKMISDHGCKFIAMHSLSIPAKEYMNDDESGIDEINKWAEKTVDRLLRLGFRQDAIIIDPGIGFGKSPYQSLSLIRSARQIKNFGCEVMFGHSRKSYISAFHKSPAAMRDLETIAISDYLSQCGVDYLRVHNVKEHQRFFVAKQLAGCPT